MQRRFWAGAARPFGFPSLNVLRLPSKRLRNRHLTWGHDASKSSFERTIAANRSRAQQHSRHRPETEQPLYSCTYVQFVQTYNY